MRRLAISDIHGCHQTFLALLDQLQLTKEDELYILGDMIDRGPNSLLVMDHIMHMQEEGYKVTALMGNHEWMFLQAIEETIPYCWDYRRYQQWVKNGGITTMLNLGFQRSDDLKKLDKKYDAFIRSLVNYVELDKVILVHAGFNFKAEDIFKDTQNMHWIRNFHESIDPAKTNNRIIIHGHSTRNYETLAQDIAEMKHPAINIDCGCVYRSRPGNGYLCALDLDTLSPTFQINIDAIEKKVEEAANS